MNMDVSKILEALANLVTIVGLPFAIRVLIRERRLEREEMMRDRKQREERAFDELDDKYVEFMRLCAAHPNLDVLEIPLSGDDEPSEGRLRAEHALLAILISLFERAYLMIFENQDSSFRERQWTGWESLMRSYARRPGFRRVWDSIGHQFDRGFGEHMAGLLKQTSVTPLE